MSDHGPDTWTADLLAAGWVETSVNVWRAPSGALFRGPYGAWRAMHDEPELNTPRERPTLAEDLAEEGRRARRRFIAAQYRGRSLSLAEAIELARRIEEA